MLVAVALKLVEAGEKPLNVFLKLSRMSIEMMMYE